MIELVDVRLDHPRGGTPLVEGANLEVARGEVVMIVGAAGVGTSRLVAAALGEVPPAGGRIEVMGRDVGKLRRSSLRLMRRRIGIVPQELCLLEDRERPAQRRVAARDRRHPALDLDRRARRRDARQLGLEDDRRRAGLRAAAVDRSSKVAVARALVREPELVIADHPTSMQDADRRRADLRRARRRQRRRARRR